MQILTARTDGPAGQDQLQRWGRRWADAVHAGQAAGLDGATAWHPAEELAALRVGDPERVTTLLAATDGERVVGGGRVDLPQRDNPDLAHVAVAVPPAYRGRGVGTALVREVVRLAAAEGRSLLLAEISRPLEPGTAPEDTGPTWPGSRLAGRVGMRRGLVDVRRDLALPADLERLTRLRQQVRARTGGYALRVWTGPTPPEDRARMAVLSARMSTDAPMGDLHLEPEVWDEARVVAGEERAAAQGREAVTAVAVDATGEWVGFTQLVHSRWTPDRLHQGDTLVLRRHRGRRLGLALKLAALEEATSRWPQARVVSTYNAAGNAPMIAVNEAMGFRPAELLEEWQGSVEDVLRAVGTADARAG
ncbi:GNAT family N-acetyltransferase [Quadrisphaera sp. DSM 44207]|uniref:GNAT family N-acetyltransferase n=1 Tax=Quadrisphaera sp. DSM 44207 TaxID=1881057 RepID=UPI00087E07B7|nr:GNAT family N-acetyltransferase [Quadrisphaera sp. DSM 44207]SDQ13899.1 Acetyltransferase (GNAT) family protein [Quadrisphaera sp. DSM 44207]